MSNRDYSIGILKIILFAFQKTFDPSEKGSQLLAEGWNSRPNYSLRYIKNCKLYVFLGIKSEEDLLLHLLVIWMIY